MVPCLPVIPVLVEEKGEVRMGEDIFRIKSSRHGETLDRTGIVALIIEDDSLVHMRFEIIGGYRDRPVIIIQG